MRPDETLLKCYLNFSNVLYTLQTDIFVRRIVQQALVGCIPVPAVSKLPEVKRCIGCNETESQNEVGPTELHKQG